MPSAATPPYAGRSGHAVWTATCTPIASEVILATTRATRDLDVRRRLIVGARPEAGWRLAGGLSTARGVDKCLVSNTLGLDSRRGGEMTFVPFIALAWALAGGERLEATWVNVSSDKTPVYLDTNSIEQNGNRRTATVAIFFPERHVTAVLEFDCVKAAYRQVGDSDWTTDDPTNVKKVCNRDFTAQNMLTWRSATQLAKTYYLTRWLLGLEPSKPAQPPNKN